MPPYALDKSEIQRLIEEEAVRQGLNPALVVAIARQESWLNPNAVGDNGKSLGLFQLQRAAAIDAGIDPNRRGEPRENIRGGVTYFKQKLQQSKGNVEQALSRYNRGTPTYQGIGDPRYVENVLGQMDNETPRRQAAQGTQAAQSTPAALRASLPERPSLTQRLQAWFTPASAEAGGATLAPGQIDWNQELLGTPTTPSPTPAPPPPPAIDWHQELLGTPRPLDIPQAPQAHPAVGRSAELLGKLGVIPTVQMEQGRPPTTIEMARQRGQEAVETGLGANIGELLGQAAGSYVAPGPGTVAGGTIGAMLGQAAEDLVRGRPFDPVAIGREGLLSAAPEAVEGALRPVGRALLRNIPAGIALRFDEAARRARQWVGHVFQPQSRAEVGAAFDAVRASGVRLDVGDVIHEVQRQTRGKYEDLLAEVRHIDYAHKTGGRFEALVEGMRHPGAGPRTVAMDIGDLQQMRSALRERLESVDPAEARQLLGDFQGAIDRSIEVGLARGMVPAGTTPRTLMEARRQWARLRSAEDMSAMVENQIRSSPNMEMLSFKLNTFMDDLRRNRNTLAQSVNRGLRQTPGAQQRFTQGMESIAQLYNTIELPMTDVAGIRRHWAVAGIGQMLSTIMTTTAGRDAFREAVTEGRGRLSLNAVALAFNVARRELGLDPVEGPAETETGPAGTPPPAQR